MRRFPTVVVRGEVLSSWLTVSDYSKSRLASELGVSKGRVSQLLTSGQEPSAHLIAKLMSVTRLPFERIFRVVREAPVVVEPGVKGHVNIVEHNGDRRFRPKERRGAADRRGASHSRSHRSRRAASRRRRSA